MSMSLWKRCSRFTINISLKVLLYLANRGFHAQNKWRKKKNKGKHQTELLERILTKTFFLIHHDLLNVQTFTQWKPDASKIFITGRTSNYCSFTVMSETDMWNNMETENQYRNDHLPIVTSHSSNWTFHWWSNDRTVILASFHRGRGVEIRIICKTICNILQLLFQWKQN